MQVVIVGASLSGLRVAEALRSGGFDGRIVLLGSEERLPYDRPPLSKDLILGKRQPDELLLLETEALDGLDLDLELGVTATGLDPGARTVTLEGGRTVGFDKVVIATGARPRPLPVENDGGGLDGVHFLRTMEDSLAIRDAFDGGARVVVVGGGFIGCEVASAAASRGLDVAVVEFFPTPLYAALGPEMGELVAGLHRSAGVRFHCGVAAEEIVGASRVEQVVLGDGTRLEADLVVVGVGVAPNTGWLEGSGLELGDGVVCDSRLRASGHPDVLAVGDVARWEHPSSGTHIRVEHWTHAAESGSFAAGQILGQDEEYDPVTYVWSDQQGHRIQCLGLPGRDDEIRVVHGSAEEAKLVALYGRQDRLTGVVSIDNPGRLMRYRALLAARGSWSDALELAEQINSK